MAADLWRHPPPHLHQMPVRALHLSLCWISFVRSAFVPRSHFFLNGVVRPNLSFSSFQPPSATSCPLLRASRTMAKKSASTSDSTSDTTPKKRTKEKDDESKPKKKKAQAHQVLTERDELPKLWSADKQQSSSSYTFKIASWNVAGLRALMKNHPNALSDLVTKHDLDVLCLQETKLQESHLDDPKLAIRGHLLEDRYDAYYSCSTAKKGYAGTAVFVKRRHEKKKKGQQTIMDSFVAAAGGGTNKKTTTAESLPIDVAKLIPTKVSYKIGKEKHDAEGRIIVVDLPDFTFCNLYVPNSGQKLERLSYRTEEWDKDMLAFMQEKQKECPVMWLGDLNVAHTNLEVWNDGAKHLPKQAGVTPEERASFQQQLDAGFVDAFRHLHPTAKGHYSYWSQRAGNREPNKGLRLDYFICDPRFFDESSNVVVRDSYMLPEQLGSDHCPVVLEVEIKK